MKDKRGFSIMELMIAAAFTGLIVAALASWVNQSTALNQKNTLKSGDLQQLQVIAGQIRDDIRVAIVNPSITAGVLSIQTSYFDDTLSKPFQRYFKYSIQPDTSSSCPAGATCKKLVRQVWNQDGVAAPVQVGSNQEFTGLLGIDWCAAPVANDPSCPKDIAGVQSLAIVQPASSKKVFVSFLINAIKATPVRINFAFNASNLSFCTNSSPTPVVEPLELPKQ